MLELEVVSACSKTSEATGRSVKSKWEEPDVGLVTGIIPTVMKGVRLTSPGQVGVQRVAQVNAAFALHHKGGGEVGDLSLRENRSNILAGEGHRGAQRDSTHLHVTFQRVECAAVVHDVVIHQQQQHLGTQTATQDRFTAFTPSIRSSSCRLVPLRSPLSC